MSHHHRYLQVQVILLEVPNQLRQVPLPELAPGKMLQFVGHHHPLSVLLLSILFGRREINDNAPLFLELVLDYELTIQCYIFTKYSPMHLQPGYAFF